jgi:citrate lyase beta subunit
VPGLETATDRHYRLLTSYAMMAVTVFFREQDVVVLPTVEGRVKVHKVHQLILNVPTQHVEIVAVVELVFGHFSFG